MDSDPLTGAQGRYFDGLSTRPQRVSVRVEGAFLCLEVAEASDAEAFSPKSWPLASVQISERLGRAQRRISLPQNALIEVADAPLWDALPQAWGQAGMRLAAWEGRWRLVLLATVGTVVAAGLFYVYALPWLSDRVAERVPDSWVRTLSQETLALVDKLYVDPSALPAARQAALRQAFAAWQMPDAVPPYRLHFRKGTRLGPNAIALPSGDIVMTDELVALAKDDKGLLGVLAHEVGHLRHKHSLRATIRATAVAAVSSFVLGDFGDVTGSVAALLQLRYSRDFEREADAYAKRVMKLNKVEPRYLADLLSTLDPEGAKADKKNSGYFSTHPLTAERLEALRRKD